MPALTVIVLKTADQKSKLMRVVRAASACSCPPALASSSTNVDVGRAGALSDACPMAAWPKSSWMTSCLGPAQERQDRDFHHLRDP